MKTDSKPNLPLLGFGLAGYRSFGSEMQYFGPLGKITLLAGPNNSGKSNVLSFLVRHYSALIKNIGSRSAHALSGLDVSQGLHSQTLQVVIPIPNGHEELVSFAKSKSPTKEQSSSALWQALEQLLHCKYLMPSNGVSWVPIDSNVQIERSLGFPKSLMDQLSIVDPVGNTPYGMTRQSWRQLWSAMTNQNGGDIVANWIPEGLAAVVRVHLQTPKIVYVPAYRRVNIADANATPESGHELIERIAMLQNPAPSEYACEKPKFDELTTFVRKVLMDDSAQLEVQHDRSALLVHLGHRRMPLANLGTGIEQVVLLAAVATLHDNVLVCLEEPEMNLHPVLQKHLMRYLSEHTTNQYLISTHSAHLLDTPGATVYRIENVAGWTKATRVVGPENHLDVCGDLGYRPSDLLQSNAVVWVEGPSDRIYLLNWLKSQAPDLVEGLHFSVMFYGGALLKHLSADEEEIKDWIALRRLNQNLAVIMDSDRKGSTSTIGENKKRVIEELGGDGRGVAWLTDARTIENYVPLETLSVAIVEVHKNAKPLWDGKKLGAPFEGVDHPDKVAIARKVDAAGALPTDRHDLKENLERIVTMIRGANPPVVAR